MFSGSGFLDWQRYMAPLTAASREILFWSRMVPVARSMAARAFTYELLAATSVDRAWASKLSYWMTKKLVEAPTSNLACSAASDSSCNLRASTAAS